MARGEQQGWWSRNWAWALPVGGCGGCLLLILIVLGGGVLLGGKAIDGLSNAAGADDAIARAEANPRVRELLGVPLERGWGFQGSVNLKNGRGEADYRVSISGPLGAGKLIVRGTEEDGSWDYEKLECWVTSVDGQPHDERIDLLSDGIRQEAPKDSPDDSIDGSMDESANEAREAA